jgi:hypothetical protein
VVVVAAVDEEVYDVDVVRRLVLHLRAKELDEFLGRGRYMRGFPVYANYPSNYAPYSNYMNGPGGRCSTILVAT